MVANLYMLFGEHAGGSKRLDEVSSANDRAVGPSELRGRNFSLPVYRKNIQALRLLCGSAHCSQKNIQACQKKQLSGNIWALTF